MCLNFHVVIYLRQKKISIRNRNSWNCLQEVCKYRKKMSHNYIVTAQKPTAVTACVTGEYNNQCVEKISMAKISQRPCTHIRYNSIYITYMFKFFFFSVKYCCYYDDIVLFSVHLYMICYLFQAISRRNVI